MFFDCRRKYSSPRLPVFEPDVVLQTADFTGMWKQIVELKYVRFIKCLFVRISFMRKDSSFF